MLLPSVQGLSIIYLDYLFCFKTSVFDDKEIHCFVLTQIISSFSGFVIFILALYLAAIQLSMEDVDKDLKTTKERTRKLGSIVSLSLSIVYYRISLDITRWHLFYIILKMCWKTFSYISLVLIKLYDYVPEDL